MLTRESVVPAPAVPRPAIQSAGELLLYALAILLAGVVLRNHRLMGANWTYPYFSGAAHLDHTLAWRYSIEGFRAFRVLPQAQAFTFDFAHEPAAQLRHYSYGNLGYVAVIWLAGKLLPFLSLINATVALQLLAHAAITVALARGMERRAQRIAFLVLYGLNPLVLQVVTLPFYYFWQVVPSFVFIVLARPGKRGWPAVLTGFVLLYASWLLRPSTLPFVAALTLLAVWKARPHERWLPVALSLVLAGAITSSRQPAEPWHTMYVGLGAYDNKYVPGLADTTGYRHFRAVTNIPISTDLPDGNFNNVMVRGRYYATLRAEYLRIVRSDPLFVARNAALNTLQGFSIGYVAGHPAMWLLSAAIGLAVAGTLVLTGQWLVLAAILASSAGFILYFPPIPAYMFGSYLLLAWGMLHAARLRGRALATLAVACRRLRLAEPGFSGTAEVSQ